MDTTSPESLMEKFAAGDPAAAAEVLRRYEPHLLRVARQRMTPAQRAKFEPADIVQPVWLHLLQRLRTSPRSGIDPDRLRGFLARIASNRRIDHVRRNRAALERERPFPERETTDAFASAAPPPADVLQADELWERMLALCPPEHRVVLRLKRDGVPTSEIAIRTGMHAGSVRRIFRTIARRLRLQQNWTLVLRE